MTHAIRAMMEALLRQQVTSSLNVLSVPGQANMYDICLGYADGQPDAKEQRKALLPGIRQTLSELLPGFGEVDVREDVQYGTTALCYVVLRVEDLSADPLVGRTIRAVRLLTRTEADNVGWDWVDDRALPQVLELSDGKLIIPSADYEDNGPGALLVVKPDTKQATLLPNLYGDIDTGLLAPEKE